MLLLISTAEAVEDEEAETDEDGADTGVVAGGAGEEEVHRSEVLKTMGRDREVSSICERGCGCIFNPTTDEGC